MISTARGPNGPPAALAKEETPLCADCLAHEGRLCVRHERSVLPQLAQPWWLVKLMGESRPPAPKKPSAEAQKIIDRKARKQERRATRLARALRGEFVPVRPRRETVAA